MKQWHRRYEWMELALCSESAVHTMDDPGAAELTAAQKICHDCRVRPECIEWALAERACSVIVAGCYLPDPEFKRELKQTYQFLTVSLPRERAMRGEDI